MRLMPLANLIISSALTFGNNAIIRSEVTRSIRENAVFLW